MRAATSVRMGAVYVPETLMNPLAGAGGRSISRAEGPRVSAGARLLPGAVLRAAHAPVFCRAAHPQLGGAKIYLKREDLLHTGAHKINNCLGQVLLARRMGKTRIIAETGAGQHGVATATVAAMFGLECVVYMGAVDCERQALNVFRMKMLGAEVVPVKAGQQTLKEAINEAMRDWVTNVRTTHYILGTVYGAHPYPLMVRNFQRVIGDEARRQILEKEERLPDLLVACVGGGSNAMGLFYPFLEGRRGGDGRGGGGRAKASRPANTPRASRAARSGCCRAHAPICCRTKSARFSSPTASAAGLDYAAVGPEHAWLHDRSRVEYTYATDDEALEAFIGSWRGWRASFPRWNPPMPWPRSFARPNLPRNSSSS